MKRYCIDIESIIDDIDDIDSKAVDPRERWRYGIDVDDIDSNTVDQTV